MSSQGPAAFHKVEVLVDRERNYKQLLIDGREVWQVQDVSVHLSTEPLTEVVVTLLTDDVTVTEASVPRDGVNA